MKKRLLLVLAIVLACGMVLAACGGGGDAPAAEPDPAPAQSSGGDAPADDPAPAPDPVDDRVFDIAVAQSHGEPVSPGWKWCWDEIEKRSEGRITITVYWSGSLLSVPEIPKGLGEGAAGISNMPSNNFPDVLPLNTRILQLPFMGLQDGNETAEIYMQLLSEFPEMVQEFNDVGIMPIGTTCLGYYGMQFTDPKPVHLPADLAGKKIIPYNLLFLPVLEANNASGSYIPPGQAYESLEKGVVDGYINGWAFAGFFALTDLVTSHTDFGEYGAFQDLNLLGMNLELWNDMPADLQQIIKDVLVGDGKGYNKMWDDTLALVANEQEKAEAKGDTFVMLNDEELAVWAGEIVPLHQGVLDEINAARGDTVANDIYKRAQELIAEKYGA